MDVSDFGLVSREMFHDKIVSSEDKDKGKVIFVPVREQGKGLM